MGFFTEDTVSFETFAEDYETIFIDRRCKKILASARSLICKPYTELATVCSDFCTILHFLVFFSKSFIESSVGKSFHGETFIFYNFIFLFFYIFIFL